MPQEQPFTLSLLRIERHQPIAETLKTFPRWDLLGRSIVRELNRQETLGLQTIINLGGVFWISAPESSPTRDLCPVTLDMDRASRRSRDMIHIGLVFNKSQLFESELVKHDGPSGLIPDYQPLTYYRSSVIDFIMKIHLDTFKISRTFQGDGQFLTCRIPFLHKSPTLPVPLHPRFQVCHCPVNDPE